MNLGQALRHGIATVAAVALLAVGLAAQHAPAKPDKPDAHAPAAPKSAPAETHASATPVKPTHAGTHAPAEPSKTTPAGTHDAVPEAGHVAKADASVKAPVRPVARKQHSEQQLLEAGARIRARVAAVMADAGSGRQGARAPAVTLAPAAPPRVSLRWRLELEWPHDLVQEPAPSATQPRVPLAWR
jgi:hypothetical protein